MANKSAAEKAMRQSERHRVRNRVARATARTKVRDATKLIAAGNLTEAEQAVRAAIRALDKAAQKGVIKKNNAARRKARLTKRLNQAKAAPQ